MKNSNIIISIIIVLCIAAAVTAYGLTNNEDSIFTNLTGFTPTDDQTTNDDVQGTGTGESSDNISGRGGGFNLNNGDGSGVSYERALEIARDGIGVSGCYPGDPERLSNGNWYVPVINSSNGKIVSGFEIDYKTGQRSLI